MSNPRIYIAITTFLPVIGGAEKQAFIHGRSLRERGYETTIITFRHDKAWSSHEVIEGVPIIRVAGTLLGGREKLPRFLQKLFYLLAMVVMGWTLWQQRKRYDILHVYQLSLLALQAALVCRLTNKPMVIAVRCANGRKRANLHKKMSLVAGSFDTTTLWLHVHERIPLGGDLEDLERFGKPVVRFTRFLLHHIQVVIVILSSRMKSDLIVHGFNLPDVELIPNGVDITYFTPTYAVTSVHKRAQVVVCIARLSYQKGIDVLLQAWHLIHKQAPQAQLIIVGHGPLQNQLESMAKALDIADCVEFAGLHRDILAQLSRGSLAVLPSRCEGMPNALLEAMASGLACVATRVSGSEDIIQHGINGLIVEPEDYHAMAEALLTLLRNSALAQEYGHAARATIEKYYSLERITDMYVELYQRIVDHSRPVAKDLLSS